MQGTWKVDWGDIWRGHFYHLDQAVEADLPYWEAILESYPWSHLACPCQLHEHDLAHASLVYRFPQTSHNDNYLTVLSMIPMTVIVLSNVTTIVQSGKASSAASVHWSMHIENVDTMCAAQPVLQWVGQQFLCGHWFFKMPPDLGSQGQQFFDQEVDFFGQNLVDDGWGLYFWFNCATKFWTVGGHEWVGIGVLRRGWRRGLVLLFGRKYFSQLVHLGGTGFWRSVAFFPDPFPSF